MEKLYMDCDEGNYDDGTEDGCANTDWNSEPGDPGWIGGNDFGYEED